MNELFLDTRAAADIWIELHKTIREQAATMDIDDPERDPLTFQERQLYDALTIRFNNSFLTR